MVQRPGQMKTFQRFFQPVLQLLVTVLLLGIWLIPGAVRPPPILPFLLVLVTVVWIGWFSVEVNSTAADITHVLGLAYGLVEQPLWAIIVIFVGLLASSLLIKTETLHKKMGKKAGVGISPAILGHSTRSALALAVGFAIYDLAGGEGLTILNPVADAAPFLAACVGFSAVGIGLISLERRVFGLRGLSSRSFMILSLLIVIPLPVAMLGASAYAVLGLPALLIFCLLIGIAAPLIRQIIRSVSLDITLRNRLEELEGLEQFAELLAVALTSQDLQAVILDQALRATGAQSGHLALFTGPEHKLVIVAVEPPHSRDEHSPANILVPDLTKQIAAESQPKRFATTATSLQYKSVGDAEIQALLGVPILDPTGNLGVIIVERFTREPFSDTDQAILVRIASQAAGAIRNARLYNELDQRLTEQSLLYQASTQIGETLETEAVALATADGLSFALKAHQVSVYQWHLGKKHLHCIASVVDGRPVADPGRLELDPQHLPFLRTCLRERKIQHWDRANAPTEADRDYLELERKASGLMIVPLAIGQRTLGLLEITSLQPDSFSPESERIAQSIAIQAAIALENTGLFQSTIEGHDRLMAIMNSTREGIIMIDLSGRMLLVNKLAGEFINLDLRGLESRIITDPEFRLEDRLGYRAGDIGRLLEALGRGTTYYSGTTIFQAAQGKSQFLQRSESPVFDSDGDLIGWLIVLRDVTQQRELEESRNQLTEMIVHDLRGPLTAILSGLTLLKTHIDEGSESPIVEQAIAVSERSVQQMLGLVNSLLTISSLESGEAQLTLESVDLTTIMREISEIYLPEANKSGIIIDTDLQPSVLVWLDREKIARVLSNLVDNALKFTPAGGQIKLSLKGEGELVDIQIADTGPGVPMEYRERIFDRYGQIPGISGRRRGTGLGLAFCKLAVDAHAGRIWVEDNPAGGSIFRIQLSLSGPAQAQGD